MQEVFHQLVSMVTLCKDNSSYVYDCCLQGRSAQVNFSGALASLLSHPLQRPFNQNHFVSTLSDKEDNESFQIYDYLQKRNPPKPEPTTVQSEYEELTNEEVYNHFPILLQIVSACLRPSPSFCSPCVPLQPTDTLATR